MTTKLISIAVAGHGPGGTILFALSDTGDLYKATITYPPKPPKDVVWELVPTTIKVSLTTPAVPALLLERIDNNAPTATHVCSVCMARWVQHADETWSLVSQTCDSCCDNSPNARLLLR